MSILLDGLSLGAIYALIALGYTMVYGIAKMLNFAHGDIIMVGAYAILSTLTMTGNPYVAVIAAIVNDLGGEYMFAQQVLAYGQPGDMLLGISTSGNARNVELAMRAAKLKGVTCVGLTGMGGGRLRALSDILIEAPETETYRVQEEHIKLYHELCARVEAAFFAE